MVSSVRNVLTVRFLLHDLETAAGLNDLTEGERNLLAALLLCGGTATPVKPGDLRQPPLAASLTHPTYHRTLRGLLERAIVEFCSDETGACGYVLGQNAVMPSGVPKAQAAE